MIVCAAVLAAALLLGACGAPAEKGETFRLNHTSLELEIGQKSALELLNGDETVTEGILWFSSNQFLCDCRRRDRHGGRVGQLRHYGELRRRKLFLHGDRGGAARLLSERRNTGSSCG